PLRGQTRGRGRARGVQARARRATALGLPARPVQAGGGGVRTRARARVGPGAAHGAARGPPRGRVAPALRAGGLRAALLHAARGRRASRAPRVHLRLRPRRQQRRPQERPLPARRGRRRLCDRQRPHLPRRAEAADRHLGVRRRADSRRPAPRRAALPRRGAPRVPAGAPRACGAGGAARAGRGGPRARPLPGRHDRRSLSVAARVARMGRAAPPPRRLPRGSRLTAAPPRVLIVNRRAKYMTRGEAERGARAGVRGTASSALDATFRALADPTRRAMLARLAAGESTVTELAAPFGVSLPAVSKHLRVLERAGLLAR